jgi:hypothetical protein
MIERFSEELKLIKNLRVKQLVYQCLEKAPDYFWVVPSSSSGKHPPKDEFVEGGKVIHVKRTVKIGNYLCECLSITGIERDCVIAALIMHDLVSRGYPNDEGHTVDGHGYLWSVMARDILTKNDFLDSDVFRTISRLIMYHMGKYDLPYILDWSDKLATCVHLADFIASREDVIIDINKTIEVSEDRKEQNVEELKDTG